MFSEVGHQITCMDIEPARIERIQGGDLPFYETGLNELVQAGIAAHMTSRKVVMNKSTVPVGMADKVAECIAAGLAARGAEISFEVCSNLEFLKEGSAVADA